MEFGKLNIAISKLLYIFDLNFISVVIPTFECLYLLGSSIIYTVAQLEAVNGVIEAGNINNCEFKKVR